MTEETKDLIRQGIVPIVLGNHRAAHRLSARLYRTFGIPSVTCGERRTVWDLFDPISAYRHLSLQGDSRLIAEQLADLAAEYEDCFLLLIPLCEEDLDLIRRHADLLESRFICRDPARLWDEPMLEGLRVL